MKELTEDLIESNNRGTDVKETSIISSDNQTKNNIFSVKTKRRELNASARKDSFIVESRNQSETVVLKKKENISQINIVESMCFMIVF